MNAPDPERTYFDQNGILITSARFVVYGQTTPLAHIAGVKPMHKPPSRVGPVIGLFVGSTILAGGVMPPGSAAMLVIGAGAMAFSVYVWRARKTIHALAITVNGTTTAPVKSIDPERIAMILKALNEAIADRG